MNKYFRICIALLAVTGFCAIAQADNILWTGLGGINTNFSDAVNWGAGFPGTPDGGTSLVMGPYDSVTTYTADVSTAPPTIGQLLVGNGADVTINNSSQTLTSNSWIILGWNDLVSGGSATMNLSGSAVLTHNNDGNIEVGRSTTGTLNVSGSAVINNNNSDILIGSGSGGTGTLTIAGDANIYQNRYWTVIGRNGGTGHVIQTGGTYTSITDGWDANIHIGEGGSTGDWIMTGGSIICGGSNFSIGEGGNGTMSITGNSTVSTTRGEFWVGNGSTGVGMLTIGTGTDNPTINVNNWYSTGRQGGNGTVVMNSGTFNKTGGGNFLVGDGGTGSFTITGSSTLNINNELWVGQTGTSNGTLTVGTGTDNPTINVGSWLAVGRDGANGTVIFNSGTINKTGGGDVSLAGWWRNGSNGATWTQNGGTFNVNNDIRCGENGNAVFTLNGGSVKANMIYRQGTGTSEFHYNGGTVELTGAGTMNVDKNYVEAGGANIILQKDVIFSTGLQAGTGILGSGGVTKSGPGNMIITANSTYTGPTHVVGGGLILNNAANVNSDVTLESTATLLAGNGIIGYTDEFSVPHGEVTVKQGVTLSPGENGTAGTLYIVKSLSLDSVKLNINVNSFTNSMVSISDPYSGVFGPLTATGTTLITPMQVASTLPGAGIYEMLQFSSITGGIGNFSLAVDSLGVYDASLQLSSHPDWGYDSLDLVLSPISNKWQGPTTDSNYWTTGNWTDGIVPSGTGKNALFGGYPGTGGSVNLNLDATVGNVIFDNLYESYTISTTNGSKFTFVPNVLTAGINDVNGSHEIAVNMITTKPLVVSVVNDTDTLTLSGAISESGGSSGLTKNGLGSLVLTGANSYTGATVFSGGTLTINTLAPAGSASSIGAAAADAGNFSIGNATLAYTGGTTATNRGMTVTGPLTLNVQNATPATVTLSGNINSVGAFVLTGNGSVVFTNSGTNSLAGYTNPTTKAGGLAISNPAVTFDGGAASVYNVGGVFTPSLTSDSFAFGVAYNGSNSSLTLKSGTLNVADGNFTVANDASSTGSFTISGGSLNVASGEINFGNAGGIATITQTGGTITGYNWIAVGRNWSGAAVGTVSTYNMSGGVLDKFNGGSNLEIGYQGHVDVDGNIDAYGHGTLNMSNNAQVNIHAGDIRVGVGLGAIGKLTIIDTATLTHSQDHFVVGVDGGVGELDLTNGTINSNEIWVGQGYGTITLPDLTTVRVQGQGTFKMNSGTVNNAGVFIVGHDGGVGEFDLAGGTINVGETWIGQGADTQGTFMMDSGTMNSKAWFVVGRDHSTGTFTMNGGTINKTAAIGSANGNVIVSSVGGTGTFTMNAGVFNNNSQLVLGENGGATLGNGTFNLNGGTMQASAVRQYQNDATGVLNFNGGVLQVSDNTGNNDYNGAGPVFLHSHYIATTTAAVKAGGAKIDTNGYTIGISQSLTSGAVNDGGLTKQGAGAMYLSATPSYNGVTTISGGSVVLDRSSLPGAVSISAGATLRLSNPSGLTGTYYNTAVADIGVYNTLSGLNTYLATLTPDVATYSSSEAGAFLDMGDGGQHFPAAYNSGKSDFQVVWTGLFHAATAGTYNFATASDDGSMLFLDGNAVVNNNNWQGITRHTGSVELTAGDHPITIAYYQGGGGYGVWAEVQQPGQQWQYLANDMLSNADPLTAQAFHVGSLSGSGSVDLGGALNTLTVNQTANETLAGVISGSGSLLKDGPAKLTLTQDIAYTGDTIVNNGILVAQNMTTSANISVLGTAQLDAVSIVTGTLTIGGTPVTPATAAAAAVPEPGTLTLLVLAGLALVGACLRRK